jgi:hypothetical protein
MNLHQARYLRIYLAISEAIDRTYGAVSCRVVEDIATEVVMAVILDQAYAEKSWRDLATPTPVTDQGLPWAR